MKLSLTAIVASLLLVAALVTVGAGVLAQPLKGDKSAAGGNALVAEDDKAIRKTITGFEESWNTHDMKAFGKLLREDVEWVNIVGMHWRGREAVVAAHAAYHETMFKNHTLKTDTVHLRSLGGGHVIAVVTTTNDAFTTPAGQAMSKAQNRMTYVLTEEADGWKIAHCQNVVVNADAAKHDPLNGSKK